MMRPAHQFSAMSELSGSGQVKQWNVVLGLTSWLRQSVYLP